MSSTVGKLRRLLTPREQKQAVLLFVMMILGAVLEMIGVGAIPAFIALLSEPGRARTSPVGALLLPHLPDMTAGGLVVGGAAVLLVLFVIKNSYIAMLSFAQARYVTNRQVRIASSLLEKYLANAYTFHLQRNSAELLRNANNEALEVVGSVLVPGLTLCMELLTVSAILTLLVVAEPFVSLVGFVLLGGATFLSVRVVRRRLLQYGAAIQDARLRMIKSVNEGLGAIKITKSLGRESYFLHEYRRQAYRSAEAQRFRQVMLDLPRLYLETASMVGLLVVAAVLISEKRPVGGIIATLSLLAVAVVRMIPSFNRITGAVTTLRYGRFSLDAVFKDLVEAGPTITPPSKERETELTYRRVLELADVHFTYPGAARPALSGVSMRVPRGQAIGIVGPTGSGKTTLVDIILGLLVPDEGEVLLDGRSIRGTENQWRTHVGYVPQDVYLLDDSIRHNIAFGLPDEFIDDEAVTRAAEAAQLSTLIKSLPAGMESVVGERGVRLSGGQRQRIGIARALYNNPSVVVLDEATSSLDHETERFVMEAIEALRGERTLIIIAHRISTVRACDRLFLLADGRVVSSGTYDELLASDGQFRRLAIV